MENKKKIEELMNKMKADPAMARELKLLQQDATSKFHEAYMDGIKRGKLQLFSSVIKYFLTLHDTKASFDEKEFAKFLHDEAYSKINHGTEN